MKFPNTVLIKSSKNSYNTRLKIAGLFLIERNILLLAQSGFQKIYLSPENKDIHLINDYLTKKIKKKYKNIEILIQQPIEKEILVISPNTLLQQYQLKDAKKYFTKSDDFTVPVKNDEIFEICSKTDVKKAEKILTHNIIINTGGVIAQKLNKRLSIPVSLLLCKTGIHPNFITFFNFLLGIASAFFLFLSGELTGSFKERYIMMALGGFLFQMASVLDGVDGEVAKLTLRSSKLGGWLDTAVDNLTLLFFLIAASFVNYQYLGGLSSVISTAVLFLSFIIIMGFLLIYTKRYSDTESLTAFDKDFLQKLPPNNPLIKFSNAMKYIIKKELFSLGFFIICISGIAYIIIPASAFVAFFSAVIILTIFFKYRNRLYR